MLNVSIHILAEILPPAATIWLSVLQPLAYSYSIERINNREAVVIVKTVLPSGWHLPDETKTMETKQGMVATFSKGEDISLIGDVTQWTQVRECDNSATEATASCTVTEIRFIQHIKYEQVTMRSDRKIVVHIQGILCSDRSCAFVNDSLEIKI